MSGLKTLSLFVVFFALVGVASFTMYLRGKPLLPELKEPDWSIEITLEAKSYQKSLELRLLLPEFSSSPLFGEEKYSSGDLDLAVLGSGGKRRAIWTGKKRKNERFVVSYAVTYFPLTDKAQLTTLFSKEPAKELTTKRREVLSEIAEVAALKRGGRETGAELEETITKLIRTDDEQLRDFLFLHERLQLKNLRDILLYLDIPVTLFQGFTIDKPNRSAPLRTFLFASTDKNYALLDSLTSDFVQVSQVVPWSRNDETLGTAKGISEFDERVAVSPLSSAATLEEGTGNQHSFFQFFNLQRLPVATQAVYRILLLLPIAALSVAFLRNVIGMQTFGTFMPALLALSFRETGLFLGILLVVLVVSLGLLFRKAFEFLQLLLVPRLAATLSAVVFLFILISLTSFEFDIQNGMSVALFPIVIITMIIERVSIVWEEIGAFQASYRAFQSLAAAIVAFYVITLDALEYIFFTFPESLLIVLALTLLLGRYTGFRLTELYRFRSLR